MTGVLIRKVDEDTDMCGRKSLWRQGKTVIYQPSREASEEINPANILISNFIASNCEKINFLLFEPLSLWYFITAALTKLIYYLNETN